MRVRKDNDGRILKRSIIGGIDSFVKTVEEKD